MLLAHQAHHLLRLARRGGLACVFRLLSRGLRVHLSQLSLGVRRGRVEQPVLSPQRLDGHGRVALPHLERLLLPLEHRQLAFRLLACFPAGCVLLLAAGEVRLDHPHSALLLYQRLCHRGLLLLEIGDEERFDVLEAVLAVGFQLANHCLSLVHLVINELAVDLRLLMQRLLLSDLRPHAPHQLLQLHKLLPHMLQHIIMLHIHLARPALPGRGRLAVVGDEEALAPHRLQLRALRAPTVALHAQRRA
mmetsp:Transcript_7157/g.17230  ORF Transcript_7157/g.17230 Transcript_7157/m.17230 type:complete len:248 (+) Transcript_7157:371-1114(+)